MFYVLILCSLVVFVAGTKQCPPSWVSYEGSCYYFRQYKIKLTKDSANRLCKSHDVRSSLVSIETVGEFTFLKAHLAKMYPGIRSSVHNGWLTSGKREGDVWTWATTGSAIDLTILTFGPGEPDGGEECLAFWPEYGFDMADVFCSSYERQYICEI